METGSRHNPERTKARQPKIPTTQNPDMVKIPKTQNPDMAKILTTQNSDTVGIPTGQNPDTTKIPTWAKSGQYAWDRRNLFVYSKPPTVATSIDLSLKIKTSI